MTLTSMQELVAISGDARQFLDEQVIKFLDTRHTQKVDEKFKHSATSNMLAPIEAFELEVKHKLSHAAHELLQAINRIYDSRRQNTELDIVDYLKYARINLEEAGKDIEAAEFAFKALETYHKRIEKTAEALGKELEPIIAEMFGKLEQMKNFQKNLFEKTLVLINEVRGR